MTTMDYMFWRTPSFERSLCRAAWVHSKATKDPMFEGSSGSISQTACTITFSSKAELQSAVDACLKLSPAGDCNKGQHGPINEWDVSNIADMGKIFNGAKSFNGDISEWDVSNVTTMTSMCVGATSFNGDLSK